MYMQVVYYRAGNANSIDFVEKMQSGIAGLTSEQGLGINKVWKKVPGSCVWTIRLCGRKTHRKR